MDTRNHGRWEKIEDLIFFVKDIKGGKVCISAVGNNADIFYSLPRIVYFSLFIVNYCLKSWKRIFCWWIFEFGMRPQWKISRIPTYKIFDVFIPLSSLLTQNTNCRKKGAMLKSFLNHSPMSLFDPDYQL